MSKVQLCCFKSHNPEWYGGRGKEWVGEWERAQLEGGKGFRCVRFLGCSITNSKVAFDNTDLFSRGSGG